MKRAWSDRLDPASYARWLDKRRVVRRKSEGPYYFAVKARLERGDTAIVSGWRGAPERFSLANPGHLPKDSDAGTIAAHIVREKYEARKHVRFERAKRDMSSRDCGCARCASRPRRSSRDHLPTLPGGANRYRVIVDGVPLSREHKTYATAVAAAKRLQGRPGYRGSNIRVEEWQYTDSHRSLNTLRTRKLVWPYSRDARRRRR